MTGTVEASLLASRRDPYIKELDPVMRSPDEISSMCDECMNLALKVNDVMKEYKESLSISEDLSVIFKNYEHLPTLYHDKIKGKKIELKETTQHGINIPYNMLLSIALQKLSALFDSQINTMNEIINREETGGRVSGQPEELARYLKDGISLSNKILDFDPRTSTDRKAIQFEQRAERVRKKGLKDVWSQVESKKLEDIFDWIALTKFIAKIKKVPFETLIHQIEDDRFNTAFEIRIEEMADYEQLKQLFQQRKQEVEEEKIRRANRVYEELLASEETKTSNQSGRRSNQASKKGKKTGQTSKKISTKNSLVGYSSSSSSSSSSTPQKSFPVIKKPESSGAYRVLPRISRWRTANFEDMRGFADLDKDKKIIYKYRTLSNDALCWQKVFHNLKGLETIFINKELLERYTFSYKYTDPSKKTRLGIGLRGFVKFKGKKKNIIVKIAIDEEKKFIYHMHATEIGDTSSIKKTFNPFKVAKYYDDKDKIDEKASWNIQNVKFLTIDEKGNLLMKVERPDFPITEFSFLPLSLD